MKKRQIWLLIAILCCLCLWIWLFIGRLNNTPTSKLTEDKFDKEVQCAALYPSVKQYIYDQYEYWDPNIDYVGYSRVNSIELWYSYYADRCIASVEWDRMDYKYQIKWENYYNMIQAQRLLDVNDGYRSIYTCEFNPELERDCRMEFMEKEWLYR